MAATITPGQIRQNNRLLIYHYIYNQNKTSLQDICYGLHLSRPTVTNNISALEEAGLIRHSGLITTDQVGRKAAGYSINASYRTAIGVSITKKEVQILAADLYGQSPEPLVLDMDYINAEFYYKDLCREINDFITRQHLDRKQVLGIGIAMPGLISPDGLSVTYGKLLGNTRLGISAFTGHISYPCTFLRDVSSLAVSELWASQDLDNAFFLSLSQNLGGAMIANRIILSGKHGHNAAIEHIQMHPHGKTCYCGKEGCAQTCCSMDALLEPGEAADTFFARVHSEEKQALGRWNHYLDELALLISHLHMVHDTDFILGGELASHLTEKDLQSLHDRVKNRTPFTEMPDFIRKSSAPVPNVALGAALPYIWSFLGSPDL